MSVAGLFSKVANVCAYVDGVETWQHHRELGWWAIDVPALNWRHSMPTICRASFGDNDEVARIQEWLNKGAPHWTVSVDEGVSWIDGEYESLDGAQEAAADLLGDSLLMPLLAKLASVSPEQRARIIQQVRGEGDSRRNPPSPDRRLIR